MSQKMNISVACEGAEKFVKLYYGKFDSNRHVVSKLYKDDARLIWEGNLVEGVSKISAFHENLPKSTHYIECLDAQPLPDEATGGQMMFIISTTGAVQYEDTERRAFHQNFVVTSINSEWKVMSDSFRFCS